MMGITVIQNPLLHPSILKYRIYLCTIGHINRKKYINTKARHLQRSDTLIFTLLGFERLYQYTSNVCSFELVSYLVWYLDVSDTSPLFLLHVTVGWGSPVTMALKKANLPEKNETATLGRGSTFRSRQKKLMEYL